MPETMEMMVTETMGITVEMTATTEITQGTTDQTMTIELEILFNRTCLKLSYFCNFALFYFCFT
jgi:hypothetical protein